MLFMLKSPHYIISEYDLCWRSYMPEKIIRLIFPPTLVDAPIIYQLIRQHEVAVNILSADISAESGWIDINLSGGSEAVEEAISWLQAQGVEIMTPPNPDR
jgi:ABC-type methionine transport system ATPase subunit